MSTGPRRGAGEARGAAGAAARSWSLERAEAYLRSLELFGMRFGLDRMRRLTTALGLPQDSFDSIHVVGSNGKSSTTRMIATLLRHHGLRTGTYTSPHLLSYCERVRVDDRDADEDAFAGAVARAARAAELVDRTLGAGDHVTQFEALTAAAYSELGRRGVQLAVVEAGLGGRYDATNVIPSTVQVLTNVSLEHTRWLGPTVPDITREKLAVVRAGGVLVLGSGLHPDAERVAEEVASAQGARIVRAGPDVAGDAMWGAEVPAAAFQRRNFALARAAAEAYLRAVHGPATRLEPEAVRAAAATATSVPGRFQLVSERPPTIFDGAHNPDGMRVLVESLDEYVAERRAGAANVAERGAGAAIVAVVSIMDDKDAAGMLRILLPRCAHVVFTASSNDRALPPATLESLARQLGGPPAEIEPDPHRALAVARERAGDGHVVATGSIYLLGDLLTPPPPGS
jgi:dihydrofolate synthase/folylpolyglutamate synthase